MERIYIGGLRPPQLTVQDLLERLERSLGEVLEIVPDTNELDNDSACFVHLNAKVLNTTTDSDSDDDDDEPQPPASSSTRQSALEHIAKLYHNVTWKTCKLRVEAAQPHFLQRLQDEIQERKTLTNTGSTTNEEEEDKPSVVQEPCKRRHLKIRKRFGEQVFSVDTKPYKVDSWRGMEGLLRKIERRRDHYQQERKELLRSHKKVIHNGDGSAPPPADIRTQSKLNRAVHLRFAQAEEDPQVNGKANKENLELPSLKTRDKDKRNAKGDTLDNDIDDDDDSVASSSSSDSRHEDDDTNAKSSKYVWSSSSEDESESESDNDADTGKQHGSTKKRELDPSKPSQKHFSSSSSSEEEKEVVYEADHSSADESSEANDNEAATADQDLKQQASSDDNDSEDSSSVDQKKNNKGKTATKLPSELDEFASAMVDIEPVNSDDDHDADETNGVVEDENNASLVQDVETNLGVLASLFPDMKKMQPRKVASDVHDNNGDENQDAAIKTKQSGWTPGGIMFRYDPRNDVPAKNVEELSATEEKKKDSSSEDDKDKNGDDEPKKSLEKSQDSSEESDSSDEDSGSGKDNDNDNESESDNIADAPIEEATSRVSASTKDKTQKKNEDVGDIYKQDKLEDVFRRAREGTSSAGTARAVGVGEEPSGAFSFGFDLGTNEPVDEPTAIDGGFSFSFFPGAESKPSDAAALKQPADAATEDTKAAAATAIESKPEAPTFRRRGMLFPKDVLDRYEEDFYTMNDGLKILQDLERYHKDPQVHAHWKNERQSLTLDWKRKRKYAQQARTKHQKHSKQQRR